MGELYIHHDPALSAEQERNLILLARHLIISSQQPDWIQSNFEMGTTVRCLLTGDELAPDEVAPHAGPILSDPLGLGPKAGIAALPGETWVDYQARTLGAPFNSPLDWWLFSSLWYRTDNSPIGAAMRMMYALDYGVPHDYELIGHGTAEASYMHNGFLWDRVGLIPPYQL